VSEKVRGNMARRNEAELMYEQTRTQAEEEITKAYKDYETSGARVKALDQAIVAADRNFKEQNKDYQLGLVSNLDVLTALNTLQENRRSRDRAFYQHLAAYRQLEALTGILP
jgi:outer membrane protein TolC